MAPIIRWAGSTVKRAEFVQSVMPLREDTLTSPIWYDCVMQHVFESAIPDRMLEPIARCFTPEVAKQIAELRADPAMQARIDELAEKCNEGDLTDAEHREYDAYVEMLDVVGILQAKARAILDGSTNS